MNHQEKGKESQLNTLSRRKLERRWVISEGINIYAAGRLCNVARRLGQENYRNGSMHEVQTRKGDTTSARTRRAGKPSVRTHTNRVR